MKLLRSFLIWILGAITGSSLMYLALWILASMGTPAPARPLTRAQAAPLIVAVWTAATGETPPALICTFTDIDYLPAEQKKAICQLQTLGIVQGTKDGVLFSPHEPFATWAGLMLERTAASINQSAD